MDNIKKITIQFRATSAAIADESGMDNIKKLIELRDMIDDFKLYEKTQHPYIINWENHSNSLHIELTNAYPTEVNKLFRKEVMKYLNENLKGIVSTIINKIIFELEEKVSLIKPLAMEEFNDV